jgi:hypothetical protein
MLWFSKYIVAYSSSTSSDQCDNQVGALGQYVENYEKEMFEHAMLLTPGAPRMSIGTWVLWQATD